MENLLAWGHWCERSEATAKCIKEDGDQKTRVIAGGT